MCSKRLSYNSGRGGGERGGGEASGVGGERGGGRGADVGGEWCRGGTRPPLARDTSFGLKKKAGRGRGGGGGGGDRVGPAG